MTLKDIAKQLTTAVQTVPNLVQILRDGLEQATAGSAVEVTQVVSSGTKIASVTVDDETTDLYAPATETAYSTTERKIGTWIDNSDVYEKTLSLDEAVTLASNAWTSTGVKSGEVDQLLNAKAYNYNDKAVIPVFATSKGGSDDDEIALIQTRNQNVAINAVTIQYTKKAE